MKSNIIYFCFLLLIISCNNKEKPLNDAILIIEQSLSEKELQQFAKTDERKALIDSHFRFGIKFRNEILKNKKYSSLLKYFHSKGIYHLDDMYSIIFKSLHRKLNSKNIDLEKQIKEKIKHWKPLEECKKLKVEIFKKNDNYLKGDTVQIRMMINKTDNCAYPIECQNMHPDWKFNDDNDLLIKGIILNKYYYDNIPDNKFMKVKIIEINKKDIAAPRKIFKVGDVYEVVLNYDIIEK